MADVETLKSLRERVLGAEGPDREIDADLAVALGHKIEWRMANYTMQQFPAIHWQEPHPYAGMKEPCPSWTASIDAAINLARHQFKDWSMKLVLDDLEPAFLLRKAKRLSDSGSAWIERGAIPALAIVCCVLSALIAQKEVAQ